MATGLTADAHSSMVRMRLRGSKQSVFRNAVSPKYLKYSKKNLVVGSTDIDTAQLISSDPKRDREAIFFPLSTKA